MPIDRPDAVKPALVACLCAEWCGVCRDYAQTFRDMEARFPQARFLWIDVEDEADLLHPLEVENFPTLLIVVDGQPRFLGPLRPQAETLERLIRAHLDDGNGSALSHPVVVSLAARLNGPQARV